MDFLRGNGGMRVWSVPNGLTPALRRKILTQIKACPHREHLCENMAQQMLKQDKRVAVFRHADAQPQLLFKVFWLTSWRDRRRARRFGWAEFRNNLHADQIGIPAPKPYAYFEVRRFPLAPISCCGVVTEFLQDHQPLAQAHESPQKLLTACTPVLIEFYRAGVNHIDLSPHNIFIHPTTAHHIVIDWQYCTFGPARNDTQLVLHATHMLRYLKLDHRSVLWNTWLQQLHAAAQTNMPLASFLAKVRSLEGKKLHNRDRLTLNAARLGIVDVQDT